jgi:hypothetical protein
VRQHIVGNDQIRLPALPGQIPAQALSEEFHQRGHADFLGRCGHGARRVDTQNRYAHLDEILQQVAVVACELDDQAA